MTTRRSRALAASLAAGVVVVSGLAACGSSSESGTKGPAQLTWYINPDKGNADPTKKGQAQLAKMCSDASGGKYTIKVQLLPNDASSQRQQLLRRLSAKDSGVDIMSMDPVFTSEFAEAKFIDPVPAQYQKSFTDNTVKPIIDAAKWKGTLIGAPFWANTQVLWYRKSVAKAAGLDMSKPVTWDQLVQAAKSQKKTVAIQGKLYEGYAVLINALIEGGGGHIVENPGADGDQLKWGLDSPAGKKAGQVIQNLVSSDVVGPAVGSADEEASVSLFTADSTSGFMVNWPYVWAALDEKAPKMKSDVGFARYPRTVADKESRPPLGGIVLGVSSASKHKAEAWEAISCVTTQEHQKFYMLGTGNPAANKAVYDAPEIKKMFPMADLIRESLDAGAPRPLTQYYGDISTSLQQSFSPPDQVTENTAQKASAKIAQVLKGDALL